MRRRGTAFILSLTICLGLLSGTFAAERASDFADVPADAWYFEELDYAVANGYISGTSETTFSPSDSLTRSQFVTILGRMLRVDTAGYTGSQFDDVDPDSWYGPYVAWAADMGYVNGTGPNEFAPEDNLTFEQMGTIMSNYIRKSGVTLTPSFTFSGYTDAENIALWAQFGMEMMAMYDLLPVDTAGNVRPQEPVIRSEAAVALVRLAKGDGKGGKPISDLAPAVEQEPEVDSLAAEAKAFAGKLHDELWESGEITEGMSEKEKAIVYFDWMCVNCNYGSGKSAGLPAGQEHTAYGALINRIAVCDGLSYGYQMLLETEGIVCVCIPDYVNKHMWVEAVLDGTRHTIDITFAVNWSKYPDGSINPHAAELYRDKYFMDEAEFKAKHYGTPMES